MESHKWLHLYAFFNCLLKLSAQKDTKSHWLHLYAFLNVSSNCLLEQMQSRIYCICLLFSSDFSNVSSSCLPVQMQSRISCICTFFSTVTLNCRPEKMQSRIGCIFTLFSPEEVFKCFLKSHAWTDGKSH